MSGEASRCPWSIRYAPMDGETGRLCPEVHVVCTLPADHDGYHMGDDRMPFGPYITRATDPQPAEEATG